MVHRQVCIGGVEVIPAFSALPCRFCWTRIAPSRRRPSKHSFAPASHCSDEWRTRPPVPESKVPEATQWTHDHDASLSGCTLGSEGSLHAVPGVRFALRSSSECEEGDEPVSDDVRVQVWMTSTSQERQKLLGQRASSPVAERRHVQSWRLAVNEFRSATQY